MSDMKKCSGEKLIKMKSEIEETIDKALLDLVDSKDKILEYADEMLKRPHDDAERKAIVITLGIKIDGYGMLWSRLYSLYETEKAILEMIDTRRRSKVVAK